MEELTEQPLNNTVSNPSKLDRGLLGCYIHVVSWFLTFALVMPLALLVAWLYQITKVDFQRAMFGGMDLALGYNRVWETCPPRCTWLDITIWGLAIGFGLVVSLVLANFLHKRLLNATKKG